MVILPGWQGSGADHWQSWLASELGSAGREVRFPELPDADRPQLTAWLAALPAVLHGLPDGGYDLVAHSLAALLWLHHVGPSSTVHGDVPSGSGTPRPARAALVAPVSPHTDIAAIASFFPVPLNVDAVRRGAEGTVLVGSDDDPYLPEGIAEAYGRPLKMATTVVPGGGHLNPESGFGPWPAMLDWCRRDNLAFF